MMNKTDINFTPTGDLSLFFFFYLNGTKKGCLVHYIKCISYVLSTAVNKCYIAGNFNPTPMKIFPGGMAEK